jgi:hypothetical protein
MVGARPKGPKFSALAVSDTSQRWTFGQIFCKDFWLEETVKVGSFAAIRKEAYFHGVFFLRKGEVSAYVQRNQNLKDLQGATHSPGSIATTAGPSKKTFWLVHGTSCALPTRPCIPDGNARRPCCEDRVLDGPASGKRAQICNALLTGFPPEHKGP